jgi:hypothetical protein
MKTSYTLIIILFQVILINSCKSVEIEDKYQDCVYQSLRDKGLTYKRFMKGFENHLIKLNILENREPSGYYSLYKSIANKTTYPINYKYSYIDSLNSIEKYKIIPFNKSCYKSISAENSKMNVIKETITEKHKKQSIDLYTMMKANLTVLEEDDFKLDYYKHRAFIFLQMSGHSREIDSLQKTSR